MNMIKKIALTASILLFVLTQIFSFYLIYASHLEKIELLKEKEQKIFDRSCRNVMQDLTSKNVQDEMLDYAVTYSFRKNMPSGSALYKGKEEIYNSSIYEFNSENIIWDYFEDPFRCRSEKINGKYLLLFYAAEMVKQQNYQFFYVVDVTSVYEKSIFRVLRELLFSFAASVAMALLLSYLIKKITRPLQAVNEAQRQLIGSISHELKTPLTAIKGYSETLLSVKLSEEQREKSLRYINRESGRLSRLSEKMMELTKLYEPECKITLRSISVEELFETVAKSVRHKIHENGLELLFEGSYQNRTKELDEDLMTSFLINLVNNSIMASKAGGRIYMGADEHSIWVRDEGCGISAEEVEKVRKAFYRVDKSRSRKSGNMGLGLALCEQIAAVHHGRMEIESELSKGTKVLFTNRLQRDEYL